MLCGKQKEVINCLFYQHRLPQPTSSTAAQLGWIPIKQRIWADLTASEFYDSMLPTFAARTVAMFSCRFLAHTKTTCSFQHNLGLVIHVIVDWFTSETVRNHSASCMLQLNVTAACVNKAVPSCHHHGQQPSSAPAFQVTRSIQRIPEAASVCTLWFSKVTCPVFINRTKNHHTRLSFWKPMIEHYSNCAIL